MHSENYQDGYSTRVRHVPIQVESRDPSSRGYQKPSDDQANDQSSRINNDQVRSNSQNIHHNNRYSPSNTSSINIDYKPPTPQRRPNINNQTDENLIGDPDETFSLFFGNQDDNRGRSSREHVDQQSNRTSRRSSRNRQDQRSSNPSPNSDKLVSSPEPIPLPPPPSDQNQHHNHNSDHSQKQREPRKQQQQSGGINISLDNRLGENPSPHVRDGHASPQQKTSENQGQQCNVSSQIKSIRDKATSLLQEIKNFDGISAKSKEYIRLDEMLTRCILSLDDVECGDNVELKQLRKASIQLVDIATDILQRKVQINLDIHDLYKKLTVPS